MKTTVGFALTGSFCTFDKALAQMEELVRRGFDVLPILSYCAAEMDTRFFTAREVKQRVEAITGRAPLCTLQAVEPLGPKRITDVFVVAPITGNSLAKLAAGIYDTPPLLGVKSHLRAQRPVVLAISTNDGLSSAAQNIGRLLNRKGMFFVPFAQDDPYKKPCSLVARFDQLPRAIAAALAGAQLQPLICGSTVKPAEETLPEEPCAHGRESS